MCRKSKACSFFVFFVFFFLFFGPDRRGIGSAAAGSCLMVIAFQIWNERVINDNIDHHYHHHHHHPYLHHHCRGTADPITLDHTHTHTHTHTRTHARTQTRRSRCDVHVSTSSIRFERLVSFRFRFSASRNRITHVFSRSQHYHLIQSSVGPFFVWVQCFDFSLHVLCHILEHVELEQIWI